MRLAVDKQNEYARELVARLSGRDRRRTGRRPPQRRPEDRAGHLRPARARQDRCATSSPALKTAGGARPARTWPTRWCARASGRSAATAGPTTSATAGSTTCWPPAATSTSWCSTPRSTPTPAGRCPRPRRAARWPSSRPAASRSAKKDLAMIAMTYGNVYVARVAMGANDMHTRQGLPRSRGLRRAEPDHRLQPLHRARLRPGPRPRAAEGGRQLRPLAAVPLQPGAARPRARTRSSSIPRRRRIALKDYVYNETRYTMLAKSNPEQAQKLLALAQQDVQQRWKLTSTGPACRATARARREGGK